MDKLLKLGLLIFVIFSLCLGVTNVSLGAISGVVSVSGDTSVKTR